MKEEVVDLRLSTKEELELSRKQRELLFEVNQMAPYDPRKKELMRELFGSFGEGASVATPLQGVCFERVHIAKGAMVNTNCLMMARGGIEIEEDVMIASNAQLITNNHDFYERMILTCKPIHIKKGAWIGAGATILPGVTVGKYAIVGAASVVSKDVDDYAMVVGNPARKIKELDRKRFEDG